jgi:hypothetical protein
MALKKKIAKEAYEKLPEDLKALYRFNESKGEAVLDVEAEEGDDVGELRRANTRNKERAAAAEKKLQELQDQLDATSSSDAKKRGDIETLEKGWLKEKQALIAANETAVNNLKGFVKKFLIDNNAVRIANEISTVPLLMADHISKRLDVDFAGEEPKLIILGDDGKPSNMSLEDLSKNFMDNKSYSSIIVGSRASGGGAGNQGSKNTNSGDASKSKTKVDLSSLSTKELAAHMDSIITE